ncbi:hypothetical protein C8J57DRAFT_1474329 [Mycena rebaudengoi]|nr:hypothetical protein C8J57DRAFT_1474329 [Mycena rebaudengoi]
MTEKRIVEEEGSRGTAEPAAPRREGGIRVSKICGIGSTQESHRAQGVRARRMSYALQHSGSATPACTAGSHDPAVPSRTSDALSAASRGRAKSLVHGTAPKAAAGRPMRKASHREKRRIKRKGKECGGDGMGSDRAMKRKKRKRRGQRTNRKEKARAGGTAEDE